MNRILVMSAALLGVGLLASSAVGEVRSSGVLVTMGKPSEYRFTLSSTSALTGAVTFTLSNRGKKSHDFRIAGKTSPVVRPGKTAVLTVTFSKAGGYAYSSTVAGDAAHGMKGTLSIHQAASGSGTGVPTTPTPGGSTTSPGGSTGATGSGSDNALSVNEAGKGFLGTWSHTLVYHST